MTIKIIIVILALCAIYFFIKVIRSKLVENYSNEVTVVTAASSNHFKSSIQLLTSLKNFPVITRIVYYDLGLTNEEIENIKKYESIVYKKFNYELYPDYFDVTKNAGEYAWKPTIIDMVSKEYGGILLWTDSGNIFNDNFNDLISTIKTNNLYSSTTSGNIKDWTFPKTLEYLKTKDSFLSLPNRNGACIGFNLNTDWVKNLIYDWKKCAATKECIAPTGSNRSNHRQDQAVFSILYYKYHYKYNFNIINEYIGFSIHNDID